MNPLVELNLALILFLPWYVIVGWLFMRGTARGERWPVRLAAAAFVVAALVAAAWAGIWAFGHADVAAGRMWQQILATVIGYGAFLAVIVVGFFAMRAVKRAGARPRA